MFKVTSNGGFDDTRAYLEKLDRGEQYKDLARFGQMGVDALSRATPVDSGLTASLWTFDIVEDRYGVSVEWHNTNQNDGVPIAIILQYGHGTGTGGYVAGYDYINPAVRPIFDQIEQAVWREVTG